MGDELDPLRVRLGGALDGAIAGTGGVGALLIGPRERRPDVTLVVANDKGGGILRAGPARKYGLKYVPSGTVTPFGTS